MGVYSVNRTLFESEFAPDYSFDSLIESVIQIHENDHKMFESLIECDFIQAHNEAYLTEEEASNTNKKNFKEVLKNIGAKIKELVDKAISAIKKAAGNITYKISELVRSDASLVNKYGPTLNMENLEGFPGIKNFALYNTSDEFAKYLQDISEKETDLITRMVNTQFDDRNAIDTLKKDIDDYINEVNNNKDKQNVKAEENWIPSYNDIKNIIVVMQNGSKNIINGVKATFANSNKTMEEIKTIANNILKDNKTDHDDDTLYGAKSIYDMASKLIKFYMQNMNATVENIKRQFASARKAFIICGRYAYKKAHSGKDNGKEDVNSESAINYILGEMSDQYVYEALCY